MPESGKKRRGVKIKYVILAPQHSYFRTAATCYLKVRNVKNFTYQGSQNATKWLLTPTPGIFRKL